MNCFQRCLIGHNDYVIVPSCHASFLEYQGKNQEKEFLWPNLRFASNFMTRRGRITPMLHAAMERHGFSRLVKGNDGRTYQLPWAEYNGDANLSSMQVLTIAQRAANTTGKKNSVLVTEVRNRAWAGLSLARN